VASTRTSKNVVKLVTDPSIFYHKFKMVEEEEEEEEEDDDDIFLTLFKISNIPYCRSLCFLKNQISF
jgi:hypothetical protein